MRHEYAETAIDVIARRCRLSFLNAQAALDALPRVIEIMAEELRWPVARVRAETAAATEFLGSMGLMPGAAPRPTASEPKGVLECMETALGVKTGRERRLRRAAQEMVYSRAQFESGELEALKRAFEERARATEGGQAQDGGEPRLETGQLYELVKGLPGFDAVRPKDYEYVMEEVGYGRSKDVDWNEFVEVSLPACGVGYPVLIDFPRVCRSAPSCGRCYLPPFPPRRTSPRGGGYRLRRVVEVSEPPGLPLCVATTSTCMTAHSYATGYISFAMRSTYTACSE